MSQMYNQERRRQMATNPPKKSDQKPGKRRKISLDRIVEKDLELPADALKNVKGGLYPMKSLCKGRTPKLVPIPPKLTCPLE